jgi:hypothetical protein
MAASRRLKQPYPAGGVLETPASITDLRAAHLSAAAIRANDSILRRIAIPVTRNSQVQAHRHAADSAITR